VEVAGEVAFGEACGLARCLVFAEARCDGVACRGVVLAAVEDDGVQRTVELAVTAAAEPVTDRLSA